tara:strand:+ start:516 stop:1226 length:711 start_codon:yes stop_codon:yes gene_type:complete
MSKRILISGGHGKLNSKLLEVNSSNILLLPDKSEMDITQLSDVEKVIKDFGPTHFLHTAAITRPMAIHEKDPSISIATNIIGTANCAIACIAANVKLIYISTDFVYPGISGNYKETDGVNPFTNYGWSKLGGECSARMSPDNLILRLAMCQKPFPHPKALVDMIKSPIYVEDVAKIIFQLIDEKGIINIGGKAQSVFDFVKDDNPNIGKIKLSEISDVNMATDCSMDINKLKEILK